MAQVTTADIKKLRELTGAGMSDVKTALVDNDGDLTKATAYLREKGLAGVAKRGVRSANTGLVHAYLTRTANDLHRGSREPGETRAQRAYHNPDGTHKRARNRNSAPAPGGSHSLTVQLPHQLATQSRGPRIRRKGNSSSTGAAAASTLSRVCTAYRPGSRSPSS